MDQGPSGTGRNPRGDRGRASEAPGTGISSHTYTHSLSVSLSRSKVLALCLVAAPAKSADGYHQVTTLPGAVDVASLGSLPSPAAPGRAMAPRVAYVTAAHPHWGMDRFEEEARLSRSRRLGWDECPAARKASSRKCAHNYPAGSEIGRCAGCAVAEMFVAGR